MTPTIDDVQRAAIAYYPNLEPGWISSPARARRVAWPRQVAITVARRITGKSLPQIGRKFCRDHTTAISAIRATERRLRDFPDTIAAVEAITELAYRIAEFRTQRPLANGAERE